MPMPSQLLVVRQNFPHRGLADTGGETRAQMETSGMAARLRPGARVAIGVGSRGISNLATIVAAVVAYWRDHGMEPFIVPAMGSHGAATAAGQADVLGHYGVTAASMGCPIVSRLEVVSLGRTADGIEVFMDAAARAADAVMVVSRVKWHTSFTGAIESGMMKMLSIGLGKFAGAQKYHAHGQRLGLEHVIRTSARCVLDTANVVGALAIVEDAYHHTARIDAVPAQCIERRDEEHLALAKSWMPKLPCDLDVLVVDEIGKNISGTGMDAKVVNRGPACEYNSMPELPAIGRIFVRDLDPDSYGNALGIGMADVTTTRVANGIDWEAIRINALSSAMPQKARLPLHFASDRECLDWLWPTTGRIDPSDVTYGWIHNSLAIDRIAVSANLRAALEGCPQVSVEGEFAVEWDEHGNLRSPF